MHSYATGLQRMLVVATVSVGHQHDVGAATSCLELAEYCVCETIKTDIQGSHRKIQNCTNHVLRFTFYQKAFFLFKQVCQPYAAGVMSWVGDDVFCKS